MRTWTSRIASLGLGLLVTLTACSQPASAVDTPATAGPADTAAADGPQAADFTLTAVDGTTHSLSTYLADGKTVVLEWFNPDCPFTRAYHTPAQRMVATRDAAPGDIVWLAINSGAPGKQGSGLERNLKAAEEFAVPYPILLDESGDVGRAYGAKTTPHMIVITPEGVIAYDGAIDDSGGKGEAKSNHVATALAELAAGKPVSTTSSKPFGCSVKYAQ